MLRIYPSSYLCFSMKRTDDTIDLPVPLHGDLRERFAAFFRELSVNEPDLTPSALAARLLADILEADLIAERPELLH